MRNPASFDLQGHRGARGLKPENTLPSFETAIDFGVSSIETDVHLTLDGVPILTHDPFLSYRLFRQMPGSASLPPAPHLLLSSLTLAELRGYRADQNPDSIRFSSQDPAVTPATRLFTEKHSLDPYAPPPIADLFAFAEAYAGELGERAGKSEEQRTHARQLRFDLELKRVPFHPEYIADEFDGESSGLLEQRVVEAVRSAGVVERTTVRSFDHRSIRAVGLLEPLLTVAVLIAGTVPVDPVGLARQAGAQVYCPEFTFLDVGQVRQLHAANIRVLPWTVNGPEDWERLLDWGVDGITTDYPDRLAVFLSTRPTV